MAHVSAQANPAAYCYCADGGLSKMDQTQPKVLSTDDDALPKIARRSLAEQIADELRDLVLLEKLAPGSTIPELSLIHI